MLSIRKSRLLPILVITVAAAALAALLYLRAQAPPEAARLLPESDAIVYVHLKPLRAATHFDQSPAIHSTALLQFTDATGIVPERDIDEAAIALHRVPAGLSSTGAYLDKPKADLYTSEVFIGHFDGQRLAHYLTSIATSKETYANRDIYTIAVQTGEPGGQTLRVAQAGYDTIVASNMPTSEQVHSMLDRARASALSSPGSSLLAARYSEVPRFPLPAQAWGIGHIGLPLSSNGKISVMGLDLPLPEDTDFIASLSYSGAEHLFSGGAAHLRVEEIAPDATSAANTVETLTTLLNVVRDLGPGLDTVAPAQLPAAKAMHDVLASITLEQKSDRALLNANASADQLRLLFTHH